MDDITLFINTFIQAESLLHSLEQTAGDTGLHVNANKMKFRCYTWEEAISTLNGGPLKLVDKYLGSSISSTESDVNLCQSKV